MWPAELIARFPEAKAHKNGEQFAIRCRVHEDNHASATITIKADKAIVNCLVCCHAMSRRVFWNTLLERTGTTEADWFAESARKSNNGAGRRRLKVTTEDVYTYRNAKGELVFEVCRFRDDEGNKTFRARRPRTKADPAPTEKDDPKWIWERATLDTVGEGVIYNMPAIYNRPAEPVYVVEGERDADNLNYLDFVSTTNAFGAGNWGEEHAKHIAGRKVCIVQDNDVSGRRRTIWVAGSLIVVGATAVRWLTFPELPEKADVTDFLYAAIAYRPKKPYTKPADVFTNDGLKKLARDTFLRAVQQKSVLWHRKILPAS